jgi:hypothetical protein
MGKIGDVSGGVEGKIGDVSGDSTLAELTDLLLQDRAGDDIACLAARVSRLQNEVRGIARWLDLRIKKLEETVGPLKSDVTQHGDDLAEHDERLDALENPLANPAERPNKI